MVYLIQPLFTIIMKTLFTLVMTLQCVIIFAQSKAEVEPHNYITTRLTRVYKYDALNSKSINSVRLAAKGLVFEQIGLVENDPTLGDVYVIQFWNVTTASDSLKKDTTRINSRNTTPSDFYCIKVKDFNDSLVKKRYKTWGYNGKFSLGILALQAKMRPRKAGIPFDFAQDFSLGTTIGYSFRTTRYKPSYLSIVGTLGLTSVGVDSLTTRGYVNSPAKFAAYTYGFGIVYEVSYIQMSVLVGWDRIGGFAGQNWIYNNRNWFSIGLGVQLWKPKD